MDGVEVRTVAEDRWPWLGLSFLLACAAFLSLLLLTPTYGLDGCSLDDPQGVCRTSLPRSLQELPPVQQIADARQLDSMRPERLVHELRSTLGELLPILRLQEVHAPRPEVFPSPRAVLNAERGWTGGWRPYELEKLRRVVAQAQQDRLSAVLADQGAGAARAAQALLDADPGFAAERDARVEDELARRRAVLEPLWANVPGAWTNAPLVAGLFCLFGLLSVLFGLVGWHLRSIVVRVSRHQVQIGAQHVLVEDCAPDQGAFQPGSFSILLRSGERLTLPARQALTQPDHAAVMEALRTAVRGASGDETRTEARAALRTLVGESPNTQ